MYCGQPVADRAQLGPGSLLWRWAGDTRIGLLAGPVGLLQTMHPAIGAALVDHSDFFDDPADRVVRSLPSILGTIYDDPSHRTGNSVRDYHRDIKGTEPSGRAYHALEPSTYWWAHATFQYMVEQVVDRFDRHRLTDLERERLYQEGAEWYRRYGVSDRYVPETRAAFEVEWDRYCEEVLQPNAASDWLIEVVMGRHSPRISTVPHPVPSWTVPVVNVAALQRIVRPSARVVTFGGLPPRVRERFGIPWTRNQERRLRALEASVRQTWRFLPAQIRWQPRARAAWRRVGERPPR
jgi:uncharacterized protein (DUF2236 family)